MQELIKIVGLLPVKDGKSELRILAVKGGEFTIAADPKGEVGGLTGIREFTIESPTLKKLGIKANESAYLVADESAIDNAYDLEYTAPAKKVASESVGKGRSATPNFSIQR
ncbi:hypothetical protein HOV30_gp122 [Erwinia phage Derbicus]|uniref:Uncharacterized protein n=2 Tax=Derbicusvirus derbicus TaxID=2734104 RepID=A0A482IFM6_9CAUD|nr:hypothetical protein BIZ82_gp122 [Erwinia phage vB_EamM_EarlPhillipIV]YP_009821166.1 hypothetical protein HOV30_gp122 [Erwinia phage Derbicus]ANZ48971.1 hypothetical protein EARLPHILLIPIV_122 [Erwinia phage vB_EamM_EarlPhillipIV]QBP07548.1 hypothetical protein DERBICUS_122 [Erwinia phage Derbicus]